MTVVRPASGRAAVTVGILLLLYVVAFIDRVIPTLMVAPLKRDLGFSDVQIGLLIGPAFGILYVIAALPLGWLIDRLSKRLIVGAGVVFWGLATLLGGFAANAAQLIAGRGGVAIGEATLAPAAHAIIADTVPPRRLSRALAIFTLGSTAGSGLALIGGGLIVQTLEGTTVTLPLLGALGSWRLTFVVVGLATVLLAPLALLLPSRFVQRTDRPGRTDDDPTTLASLIRGRPIIFLGLPLGFAMTNLVIAALIAWSPTYMVRAFGWTIAETGVALGVQHILCGSIGQVGNAVIVDWLHARGMRDAHVRYHMLGWATSAVTLVLACLSGSAWVFLVLSSVFFVLTYPFIGYAGAGLQLLTPPHLRGQVAALFLAIITLVASLVGAPLTAWLAGALFTGSAALGKALAVVTLACAPLSIALLWLVGGAIRRVPSAG